MDIGLSWGNGAVDQSQARRLSSLERLYCKNVIPLIREIEILEARLGDNYRAHPEFFDLYRRIREMAYVYRFHYEDRTGHRFDDDRLPAEFDPLKIIHLRLH